MYYVSAQGVDVRDINVHYYSIFSAWILCTVAHLDIFATNLKKRAMLVGWGSRWVGMAVCVAMKR